MLGWNITLHMGVANGKYINLYGKPYEQYVYELGMNVLFTEFWLLVTAIVRNSGE